MSEASGAAKALAKRQRRKFGRGLLATFALLAAAATLPLWAYGADARLDELLAEKVVGGLSAYLVSEKLDGVRARWDGERLTSRNGNVFAAPEWFTANFPPQTLDGELWLRRGAFAEVSGAVRRKQPHHGWRDIHYYVFDLPDAPVPFARRVDLMRALPQAPHLSVIPQTPVADAAELAIRFAEVIAAGGEGLMLRRMDSMDGADIIKLKPYDDAEAVVVAHNPGAGKHLGRLGSLTVERPADRRRFRIGTGFSDADRDNPPPIGTTITYRYRGFTKTGLPRFASFLRIRDDEPPAE